MSIEEIFAEATERFQAGEPLESIVTSYGSENQQELRALLAIVEITDSLATQPVPEPSPARRAASREIFLERAALKHAEYGAAVRTPAYSQAAPSWWQRTRAAFGRWSETYQTTPALRLAPLLLLLLVLYGAVFSVVKTAQASYPGDPAYPFKVWARDQKVALATPENRSDAIIDAETQIKEETAEMARRAANRQSVVIQMNGRMIFYNDIGNTMKVGPLRVLPKYQTNLTEEEFIDMKIIGDPEPGATVILEYQILPGNPDLVQGMSMQVLTGQAVPTPAPTATPTATPCQRILPDHWEPYSVRSGDTLSGISSQTGASVDELRRVNCIGPNLRAGTTILAPAGGSQRSDDDRTTNPAPTSTRAVQPTPTMTPIRPTASPVPTEEVLPANPKDTATTRPTTVEPTATAPVATATLTPAVTPDAGTTATDIPDVSTPVATATGSEASATPTSTPDGSASPTTDASAEPTAGTPSPAATATEPVDSSATPAATGTSQATPSAVVTPTEAATAATSPTALATPAATATTAAATSTATKLAPPTSAPTQAPTDAPTQAPTAVQPTATQSAAQPSPTAQGGDSGNTVDRSAAPTPVPPTPVPPTPVPPTPVPPTPVPPTPVPPTPVPPTPVPPTPVPPTPVPPTPVPPTPVPPTPTATSTD